MLKTGDKVKVKLSGTTWDGSEGIVQYVMPCDKYPIFVVFQPHGGNGFKYSEVEKVDD